MELCDKYIHECITLNPSINDYIKIDKYNNLRGRYENIYSDKYCKQDEKIVNKYLTILKNKKNKNEYDKLFYRALNYDNKVSYFPNQYLPLSSLDNIYLIFIYDIKSSRSDYEFSDISSYNDFIDRLKKLNEITNSIIKDLELGIKDKIVVSDIILHRIIKQLEDSIKENNYENNYNHYRDIPNSIKTEFLSTIGDYLIKNIKKMLKFLIETYSGHCKSRIGLCSYKQGKRYYRDIVSNLTLKEYTPEKVHNLGLKYVEEYLKELKKLQKKMNKTGDILEFIQKTSLRNKDKSHIEELKKTREKIIKYLYPIYFDDKILKKDYYDIKRVTKEEKNTSAYYLLPDLKQKKKGIFYINSLNPKNINTYELHTLSLHEGYPGHHYESSINLNKDQPLYFKVNNTYISYIEGWGLYCESLIKTKNNYEIFWNIIYSLHRSIRLVVDTGIHYYGWSYEKSFQYMNKYLPMSDDFIKNEICRYIDDPGQALTYKIGEQFIQDLRKIYFKKHKNDYSGFHKIILSIGPRPLDILKEKFMSYL